MEGSYSSGFTVQGSGLTYNQRTTQHEGNKNTDVIFLKKDPDF